MKKKTLYPIGVGCRYYKIGRIKYVVSSHFAVFDMKLAGTTFRDRMQHSLKSGFADLTFDESADNMDAQGYSCSEADRGKEETNE